MFIMCLNRPDSSSRIACAVRGQPDVFLAGRGERLVGAVAVAGVRGVHVRQHQLDRRAREVVLELGGDERSAAGLRVQLEQLRARFGVEDVAHADRPDLSADTRRARGIRRPARNRGRTRAVGRTVRPVHARANSST